MSKKKVVHHDRHFIWVFAVCQGTRFGERFNKRYSIFSEHITKVQTKSYFYNWGAQWLIGRVLDSRPRSRGFEPHRRHCVVALEQDTVIIA